MSKSAIINLAREGYIELVNFKQFALTVYILTCAKTGVHFLVEGGIILNTCASNLNMIGLVESLLIVSVLSLKPTSPAGLSLGLQCSLAAGGLAEILAFRNKKTRVKKKGKSTRLAAGNYLMMQVV